MKIIILGAGQVGGTLAQNLVNENNDITVIDSNPVRLQNLQNKFDLRTLIGNASSPRTLREAGAADADLLVAVTSSDETNMIACQIGYTLFNIPKKIARIRNQDYIKEKNKLFQSTVLPIDHIIAPEKLVIEDFANLINYPGALQVFHFCDRKISLVAIKAYYGGPLVGYPISMLKDHLPYTRTKIVSILRQERYIRPQESTIIEAGDEITFITATENIKAIMSELQRLEKPYRQIMIVGGGNIGAGLADHLSDDYRVKLIEKDAEKAEILSEKLPKTLVFAGDASDQTLLFEEHIDNIDVFLSLTSDDENNIMSALLAKRLGAAKAMVLIQRIAYLNLVQGGTIDIGISPQQSTVSALLSHVRQGDVKNVALLRKGNAEVIEIVAHGNEKTSYVVNRKISQLKLPTGCIIAAIYRNEEVHIANQETMIEDQDHVIIYLSDKKQTSEIEKLFQPTPFFI